MNAAAPDAASSTAEYDAFGPWIDEVASVDDVPRMYRGYPIDFGAARIVLKFPRDIPRREATPQMDLYDHLLIVTDDRLTILSRTGDRFAEVGVAHDRVAAITDWVNLLDARLVIHTLDGDVVSVAYNGSSNDSVAKLVDLLRELAHRQVPARKALPAGLAPLALDDLGKKDALMVTTFRELVRREPAVRLAAAHGRTALKSRSGAVATLLDLFVPATLHACIVGVSDTELHIVSRREWIVRGGAPEVSRAHTVIPLEVLGGATVADHPRFVGVSVVTLPVGHARIEVLVPEDSAARTVLLTGL
jgi:hypothetical protein